MQPMTDANQTDHLHHALSSGADEQPTRLQQQQLRIQREGARYHSRTPPDRAWLRGLVGLLVAACIIAGAFLLRSPHGDAVARWIPQFTLPSSAPPQKSAADVKARAKRDQVTAATAMAERVTAATEVAILMARPEIKSLSDLAGRSIAIDDREDVVSGRVRTAMAAAGAAEVQLISSQAKGDRPRYRWRGARLGPDIGIAGRGRRVSGYCGIQDLQSPTLGAVYEEFTVTSGALLGRFAATSSAVVRRRRELFVGLAVERWLIEWVSRTIQSRQRRVPKATSA
jgi:hypothetical protein